MAIIGAILAQGVIRLPHRRKREQLVTKKVANSLPPARLLTKLAYCRHRKSSNATLSPDLIPLLDPIQLAFEYARSGFATLPT